MDFKQLEKYIIDIVLKEMSSYRDYIDSYDVRQQMLGIIAQESHGKYIKQLGNAPACGIIQMEPATARDIQYNYLKYRPELDGIINRFYNNKMSLEENLIGNLHYQVAMLRTHLLRCKGKIPSDLIGQAKYWKDNYNTSLGKGTVEEYVRNYNIYIVQNN